MAKLFNNFWEIINSTNPGVEPDRRSQVQEIYTVLKTFSLEDLASFKRQLNVELAKAYTFNLIVAAFVIYSRISDDMFLEFRAWLILHGKKTFEDIVNNPDNVTKIISKREVDKINCGGLPELPTSLWLDRGGNLKMYAEKAGYIKSPVIKKDWPKDKEDFQKKYPVLFKAFWNSARIKSLND